MPVLTERQRRIKAVDNELKLLVEVARQERHGAQLMYLTARTAVLHTLLPLQGHPTKASLVITIDEQGLLTWSRRRGWL